MAGIKIKVSTEEAQTATRKLREDLTKLGTTSKLTEAQIQSLEKRMPNKMGADKAEEAIRRLSSSIGQGRGEIAKFQQSLAPSSVSERFASTLGVLKSKWMELSVAAVGAYMAFNKALDYMTLGAKATQAEEAFENAATAYGLNSSQMISDIRKVTLETVDASHIQQKALKAIVQGVDPKKIPDLFEAARVGAVKAGEDVGDVMDQLIDSIANEMPRGLRKFGFVTKEEFGLITKAAAAGVTEIKLLDLAIAHAKLQQIQMALSSDTAAIHIQQFRASVDELKESIGKGLNWSAEVLMGVFQGIASTSLLAAAGIFKVIQAERELRAWMDEKVGATGWAAYHKGKAEKAEQNAKAALAAAGGLGIKAGQNLYGLETPVLSEAEKKDLTKEAAKQQEKIDEFRKKLIAAAGKKEREAAAKEAAEFKARQDSLAREFQLTIDKPLDFEDKDFSDYQAKLLETQKKYTDYRTSKEVSSSKKLTTMSYKAEQAEKLRLEKEFDDKILAQRIAGYDALRELDKSLTDSDLTELQKRQFAAKELAFKELGLADKAREIGIINLNQYADRVTQINDKLKKENLKTEVEYNSQISELQAQQRLSELDGLEQMGLAHRNTLEERKKLVSIELDAAKATLETLDKGGQTEAWLQQQAKVIEYQKIINTLNQETAETNPYEAMHIALDKLYNEYTDIGRQMSELSREVASSMQTAFSDFFFDVMTGKLKSFGDYINSFLESVARSISNVLAQQAVAGIIDFGTSLFTGGGGAASYGGTYMTPGGMVKMPHSGGLPETDIMMTRWASEASFANAQRAHTGIGPEERPVIIRKDEGVFTKGQMAALAPAQPQNIKIEIKNESGEKLKVKESQTSFNPQEMVVTLWLDAWNRNAWGLRSATGV